MADVIHHYAESFKRAHAENTHIAGLGENNFIDGFVALRAQQRVTLSGHGRLTFEVPAAGQESE